MAQRQLRTIQLVRVLQAAGPLKPRRRKIPRQQQPDTIRLSYWRALMPLIRIAKQEMDRVRPEVMTLLAAENQGRERTDASGKEEQAQALIDKAAQRTVERMAPKAIYEVAAQFGERTSKFQQAQLDKQVRAAFSVPLSSIEGATPERIEGFAAANVDLIVTVPERYFDRIRLDVQQAFEDGTTPRELAESLADRFDMAEDDAMRIARDQIGKLSAQLNEDRQEAMGVTSYIWRGALDNRERDEHVEREGKEFSWDDPPEDGHPGEPIQCRCYAEPVFAQLQESVEAD